MLWFAVLCTVCLVLCVCVRVSVWPGFIGVLCSTMTTKTWLLLNKYKLFSAILIIIRSIESAWLFQLKTKIISCAVKCAFISVCFSFPPINQKLAERNIKYWSMNAQINSSVLKYTIQNTQPYSFSECIYDSCALCVRSMGKLADDMCV